ncbi:MAG TPA: FAD-dependent oxidoreductase, partial [Edaphobacter sp.]
MECFTVTRPFRIRTLTSRSKAKSHDSKTLQYKYGGLGYMAAKKIKVIGGGLAGPEAALQAARFGCQVELYEMRPTRSTEAHQTSDFAELVCSNSLKSESENTAPWLLK